MTTEQKKVLNGFFIITEDRNISFWDDVKRDPGPATQKNLKELALRLDWLQDIEVPVCALLDVPYGRYRRIIEEGKSLDCARMLEMKDEKRLTLAATVFQSQPL